MDPQETSSSPGEAPGYGIESPGEAQRVFARVIGEALATAWRRQWHEEMAAQSPRPKRSPRKPRPPK
jgi:hypothetical protein